MTNPSTLAFPCYYISATFNSSTFTFEPEIARIRDLQNKYPNSVPYSKEVTADVCLINGRFRTDDPDESKFFRMSLTGQDWGIPYRHNPQHIPFTIEDPDQFTTIYLTYRIDNMATQILVLESFTLHSKICSPGSCINIRLEGSNVREIKPHYRLENPDETNLANTILIDTSSKSGALSSSVFRAASAASQYLDPRQCSIQ